MMLCPTLSKVQKAYVDFDVTNAKHLEAYAALSLGNVDERGNIHVKQHPTLRFHLEAPFVDVPSMMNHKVGHAYLALVAVKA